MNNTYFFGYLFKAIIIEFSDVGIWLGNALLFHQC